MHPKTVRMVLVALTAGQPTASLLCSRLLAEVFERSAKTKYSVQL